MPNVEVDELQWSNAQQVATIANALLKNPKTRRNYLAQVKEAFPNIAIPEIDAAAPVINEVNELKKSMTEFMDAIKTDREKERAEKIGSTVQAKIAEGRRKAAERGYTAEGIEKLEQMMVEKGLSDFDDALKLYEYDNPPAAPARPTRGNMFDFIDENQKGDNANDYIKSLFATKGEDDGVLNNQIKSVLSDMRVGR